ncbi:hypothetical protein H2198_009595 [Neophaeococcomyces mojaviensis]|uniref:Uncharacterized protein n=1 Tax=Neophaeococcomyces mojaviensis TaxID=3383035 RepID=A0ACC2ZTX9_9EURO|nr:hypothetical protein H2198_009595 [Knufia sp. JES_112]
MDPLASTNLTLTCLPDEILYHILSFLAIPDLLQCSRACRHLHSLATDPFLHHERLQWASHNLERKLRCRTTRAAISPPNAWIWLNKTNVLSRSISKSLIRIRLAHSLEHRPSQRDLVARAILPHCAILVSPALVQSQQAVVKHKLKDNLCRKLEGRPSMSSLASLNIIPEEYAKKIVSPALVETRRRVIKESLKDGLRAWVEDRGLKAQQRKAVELDEMEKTTVKALVRRITARKLAVELEQQADAASVERRRAQARWGRALEAQRLKDERRADGIGGGAHPTRAHVLGLKRFWEGVIRTATS